MTRTSAGTWKVSDLPPPVGIKHSAFLPSTTSLWMTCAVEKREPASSIDRGSGRGSLAHPFLFPSEALEPKHVFEYEFRLLHRGRDTGARSRLNDTDSKRRVLCFVSCEDCCSCVADLDASRSGAALYRRGLRVRNQNFATTSSRASFSRILRPCLIFHRILSTSSGPRTCKDSNGGTARARETE